MKLSVTISTIVIIFFMLTSCDPLHRVAGSKPAATATTTVIAPKTPKPKDGIYAPGEEELTAIHARYKEVSMQTLQDGYALYTGVCTGCHTAKNIYSRPEEAWQGIIDEMAIKAKITDVQKDAVYKYVMAIKATQPK